VFTVLTVHPPPTSRILLQRWAPRERQVARLP
jgi:hypothetical protein